MEHHQKYESIQALIRQLHGGSVQDIKRRSDEEFPIIDMPRSTSAFPILDVEHIPRKRSIFESARIKIPMLTVTGPLSSLESPSEEGHRRFSFGHFRRHSHTAVSKKMM